MVMHCIVPIADQAAGLKPPTGADRIDKLADLDLARLSLTCETAIGRRQKFAGGRVGYCVRPARGWFTACSARRWATDTEIELRPYVRGYTTGSQF